MKKVLLIIMTIVRAISLGPALAFAAPEGDVTMPSEGICVKAVPTAQYLESGKSLSKEDMPLINVKAVFAGYDEEKYERITEYYVFLEDDSAKAAEDACVYIQSLAFVKNASVFSVNYSDFERYPVDKESKKEKYHDEENWLELYDLDDIEFIPGRVDFELSYAFLKFNGIVDEKTVQSLFPEAKMDNLHRNAFGSFTFSNEGMTKEETIAVCDYLNSFGFVSHCSPKYKCYLLSDSIVSTENQAEIFPEETVNKLIEDYHNQEKWGENKEGVLEDNAVCVSFTDTAFIDEWYPWHLLFPKLDRHAMNYSLENFDDVLESEITDEMSGNGKLLMLYPENADMESIIEICDYLNTFDFVRVAFPSIIMLQSDDSVEGGEQNPVEPEPEKTSESQTATVNPAPVNHQTGDEVILYAIIAFVSLSIVITVFEIKNRKENRSLH